MRNKTKPKTPSPTIPLFPDLTSFPALLLPSHFPSAARARCGGCGQPWTRCLCCSLLPLPLPCSSLGSLPWIQSCKHFAGVGPAHRLPFCRSSAWVLSVGCNHSGKGCSGVGTPRATGPARSVLQCGLSRVAGTPACSRGSAAVSLRGGVCSAVSLRGGAACLAVVPAAGCRGICSERETPPPSAPSLTWVRVELSPPVLSLPLSPPLCSACSPFWSSSAQSGGSAWELALGNIGTAPLIVSPAPPLYPPAPRTWLCKPNTIT